MWTAKTCFRFIIFSSRGCLKTILPSKSTHPVLSIIEMRFSCGTWIKRLDIVSHLLLFFSEPFLGSPDSKVKREKTTTTFAAAAGTTGFRPEIGFSLFIVSPPGSDVYGLFKRISQPLGASFCQQRRRCPLLNVCLFRFPLLPSRKRLSYTS